MSPRHRHRLPTNRHGPATNSPAFATPVWEPTHPDDNLLDAARVDPKLASWIGSLQAQGEATMADNREEQLYSQAPDALRQAGIDPTAETIEAWVTEQIRLRPS